MTSDEVTTSRSGRVRKPKVFYDPSLDKKNNGKRRSLPNLEAPKAKKAVKMAAAEKEPEVKKPEKVAAKESPVKPKRDQAPSAAAISNRRMTICASSFSLNDDGPGCIVCGRHDVKKGRFVNCIDCTERGHFTCLRNDKLYKTVDTEHTWQCPACKICEYCRKVKPNEQLFKCIICSNSYHLHCSGKFAPLQKAVVKKKFTCGKCLKGSTAFKSTESLLPNRKSDGFPGFAHDESAKVEAKPTASVTAASKAKKISVLPYNRPASNKATTQRAESLLTVNLDVKQENPSPTPDEPAHDVEFEHPLDSDDSRSKKTSVKLVIRKDLVNPAKMVTDLKSDTDEDQMQIEYDTKTAITPHDSVPDVRKWDVDEVYTYFMGKTTPQYAQLLKDNQIDGDALLLIKREDVLNRFDLKLGPALRLYSHIVSLQYKNNNPILAWNEF